MIDKDPHYSAVFWERAIARSLEENDLGKWSRSIFDGDRPIADAFLEELPNRARVLDFGSGIGRNAFPLARLGHDVSVCDIAETGLHHVRERARSEKLPVRVLDYDGWTIGSQDGRFDGILAWSCLDHVTLRHATALTRELTRVAKAGGILLVSFDEDKGDDPDSESVVLDDGSHQYVGGRREGMVFRPYTNEEVFGLFEDGWDIVRFEGADTSVPRRGLFVRTEE